MKNLIEVAKIFGIAVCGYYAIFLEELLLSIVLIILLYTEILTVED